MFVKGPAYPGAFLFSILKTFPGGYTVNAETWEYESNIFHPAFRKKKMILIPSSFTETWCTRVNESLRFPWHTKYKSIVWALENTVVQLSSSTALLWIYLLHSRSLVLKPLSLLNTLKQLQNLTNCFKSSNQNSIVSICSKKDSVLTKLLLTANRTAIHSPPSAQSTVLVHVQVN